jgi:phosphoglucosamine mutase
LSKLFGTTGIRGVFNKELTAEMALKLGQALGTYLSGKNILLGLDTRTSADIIGSSFISGINSTGSTVFNAGITTTPTISYLTKKLKFDAGVVITASHNPPEYIGIKFWSNSGLGFTKKEESEIEKIYFSEKFIRCSWKKVGKTHPLDEAEIIHINDILKEIDTRPIILKNIKVVVDVGSGAAYKIAPLILEKLNTKIISINDQPNGFFTGRPSKPSKENLSTLIDIMKTGKNDVGIAFDGDADRVVFIDEKGEFIHGDVMLTALARYLLKYNTGKIVTTLESSIIIEKIVESSGGEIIWTAIGDIEVGKAAEKHKALIGGEECGVYIWPEFHLGPDSIYTLAKLLEILAKENIPLSEFVKNIRRYPVVRENIVIEKIKKKEIMVKLEDKINKLENIIGIDRIDGYNIRFKTGRVLVRPSGTEPVIRITSESNEEEEAKRLLSVIGKLIKE